MKLHNVTAQSTVLLDNGHCGHLESRNSCLVLMPVQTLQSTSTTCIVTVTEKDENGTDYSTDTEQLKTRQSLI